MYFFQENTGRCFTTRVITFSIYSWIMVLSIPCCRGTYENIEVQNLGEMVVYIRHDDNRLVRFNVPTIEAKSRQQKACTSNFESLMDLFEFSRSASATLHKRLELIKIATLCSIENPSFRQMIGTHNDGSILKEIISIFDEGDAASAISGEAIWILSFNSAYNHNYFIENDAIHKLITIIDRRGHADDHFAVLAVMWAAAALQNLAASYCDTESGHCWWEYDEQNGLHLHHESPLFIDGSIAAQKIAESQDFMSNLKILACRGPVNDSDEVWPSLATVYDSMLPKLSTWAIAGLLKNLALYDSSKYATENAMHCLCIIQRSEDWLESSKAEDALSRMGIGEEECRQKVASEL